MFGLSGRLLIEMAALTLLGGLRGARIRMRDEREMRDCALAAAAMVQAAGYARDGLPDVARARLVTVILRLKELDPPDWTVIER
ncbi:hypothetical protein BI364_14070 [Acidihalobacter yilgarnensis]|uniref:Uncharacterized protein n=1 Tax=Acidihalobacter yilgarnensis TaxID=2819280 RepID=A0A1D8IR15_9GAMM|nr:hypothetical protein [Acidihalobacter yilgarnensis]AOU98931.1 hypothetical protein BI364_14070 [Acidihalobacter yilgarnensis]